MALQKTVNIKDSTISVPDAYIRIKALRCDHPDRVFVEVEVLESKDSDSKLDNYTYEYSLKEDFGTKADFNFENVYIRIKQEERWDNAQDVIEKSPKQIV